MSSFRSRNGTPGPVTRTRLSTIAPGPQGLPGAAGAAGAPGIPFPLAAAATLPAPATGATAFLDTSDHNAPKFKYASGAVGDVLVSSIVNVFKYGAKGDGVADDTASIQAAITAAAALVTAGFAGVAVYFPTGTYKQTAALTLSPNIRYFGDSGGSSVLFAKGLGVNAGGTAITNPFDQFSIPAAAGNQHILIEHLTFLGENGVNGVGFVQANLTVQNQVHTIHMLGVFGTLPAGVEVRFCKFLQQWGNPWRDEGGGVGGIVSFHHNVLFQCAGEINLSVDGGIVADNYCDTTWGIECAAPRIRIMRNTLINTWGGISIGGDGGYQYYVPDGALGKIVGATNATPIVITTGGTVGHGIGTSAAPATVRLSGVGGNTAANGVWQVTRVSATQFSLNGSVGNGAWTSGGTLEMLGDFGCQVTDNIIDITRGGGGIAVAGPCIGALVAGNQISRTVSGQSAIFLTTGVFGRGPVAIKIEDNQIHQSTNAEGIYVPCGPNHSIRRNLITNSQAAGGVIPVAGIYLDNSTGDLDSPDVCDNTVSGCNVDVDFVNGVTNVRFERNRFGTFNADAGAPFTTFVNDKVGQVTVTGAATTGSVTFMGIVNQPFPSTAYQVTLTPVSSTGAPLAGSNRVVSVAKTAAAITVTVEVAPGLGNSVTFDYVARWTP